MRSYPAPLAEAVPPKARPSPRSSAIDWAMRRGQTVVWAPSKLVLDAVDGPQGTAPEALALWLAETLSATALVLKGAATVPAGSRVPVERV